jgi:hypothetical protein
MLLAVGSDSKKVILGEVPPCLEQEQDSVQDVAAQYVQENNSNTKIHQMKEIKHVFPIFKDLNFQMKKGNTI